MSLAVGIVSKVVLRSAIYNGKNIFTEKEEATKGNSCLLFINRQANLTRSAI